MTFSDLALLSIATQKRYNWPMFSIATFAFHARICMLCMFIHMHTHTVVLFLVVMCPSAWHLFWELASSKNSLFTCSWTGLISWEVWEVTSFCAGFAPAANIWHTTKLLSRNINIYPWIPEIKVNFPVHSFHLILHIILLGLILL